MRIRILVANSHSLVRAGIVALIERQDDLEVVAQASSGRESIEMYRSCQPDVVALDLLLHDSPGDVVAGRILVEFPTARVIVVTSARGDVQLSRAIAAGVKGIVLTAMPQTVLIDTIRNVHAGRKVIPGEVASALAEHVGDELLTPREVQVLRLVSQGNRNKEAAGVLGIADETVRMHMKNILNKLGVSDRTHAVTMALSRGIFHLEMNA